MKTKDIKNLSITELEKELGNYKKEQFNLKIQKMNSQITNSARITIVRRTIAKLLTFLNQKKKA
jgi:large subunit ribosomal protein L29